MKEGRKEKRAGTNTKHTHTAMDEKKRAAGVTVCLAAKVYGGRACVCA